MAKTIIELIKKQYDYSPKKLNHMSQTIIDNNFIKSSTAIALYFIVIISISIFGLFKLIPKHDISFSGKEFVLVPQDGKDTTNSKIIGNLTFNEKKYFDFDSLILNIQLSRTIQADTIKEKDAIIKKTTLVSNYSVHPFSKNKLPNNTTVLWLIIIIGVLGASIHGITSVSEYVGNNTFDSNWALWYYLRPFVGALLALLSYWFLRAGLFTIDLSTQDLYGILAVAGLIGIFSKQALYKISDIANAVFTSNHESNLKNKLYENPVPMVNEEAQSIVKGSPNPRIVIKGNNFVASTKVFLNNKELPSTTPNSSQLEVVLGEKNVATEGELILKIVNPSPGGGEVEKKITITSA